MRYADQMALIIPCPGVIGTSEAMPAPLISVNQPGAPVTADIIETMNDPITASGQNNRRACNVAAEEGAILGQFADVCDRKGRCAKYLIPLSCKDSRIILALDGRSFDRLIQKG